MKESFLIDLTSRIITEEDLIILFEEIHLAENFIFENANIPLSEKLRGKTKKEFTDFLKKLEKEDRDFTTPNQQFAFFEDLKKTLKKIPQLKLELAFEPSVEFLLKIKQWFNEKNGQEVILDFLVNPGVVGGTIIEYQGKYCNLSVGKEIDELSSSHFL